MKTLTALLIIFFLCVFNASAAQPQMKPEVTIFESNGVVAPYFPHIEKHPDGELFMWLSWRDGHVGSELKHNAYQTRSTDNGRTWSHPSKFMVSDYTSQGLLSGGYISILSNGDFVYAMFTAKFDFKNQRYIPTDKQPHIIDIRFMKSKDKGKTWSDPIIIPTTKKKCNFPSGRIIELDNGDLLLPAYCPKNGSDKNSTQETFWNDSISTVIRSSDQGKTWGDEAIVTNTVDSDGYNEMSIVNAGDGYVYAIARENGKIFRSIDNGHKWDLFDDANQLIVAPHFLKIDKDKFFFTWCTMDLVSGSRPVYGKMYYPQKGWKYTQAKAIYNPPIDTKCNGISKGPNGETRTWDMGYPSSVLMGDDKILTIFYDAGCKNIVGGTYTSFSDWGIEKEQTITFDEELIGKAPTGFITVGGKDAVVSNAKATSGTKSLELRDTSPSLITSASRESNPTPKKTLEFKIFPEAIPSTEGITFNLLNGNNAIFHFLISPNGDLGWYNGTFWIKDLTYGGKVSLKNWNDIRVDAYSLTSANIYLNGKYAGTAHNWRSGFSAIDKVSFSTGSTRGVGVHFFIDDISIKEINDKVILTFDDDIIGQSPHGFITVGGKDAVVSNSKAASGTKSLELRDTSPSLITAAARESSSTPTKTLEFKIFPDIVPSTEGITFNLLNGNNPIFHFLISPNGDLGWYNGKSWIKDLTYGGKVSLKKWNDLRVDAYSLTSANIYLNGKYVGTAHNWLSGFSTIDKVSFSTGSTRGVGVHFFIDDVSIREMNDKEILTFDDYVINQPPPGFMMPRGKEVKVSNLQATSGTNSLELSDTSPSLITVLSKETKATSTKNLEFKIFPISAPNGILFGLLSGDNNIFHFAIFPNGHLKWYNGSSWVDSLLDAGTVSFNQWNEIRIKANSLVSADVYLNGKYSGTAHNWRSGFSTMDRVYFASGASAGIGDHFFVDDLSISAFGD